ncbi:MAG TPA: hypothetical protein VGT00_12150 [Methylomirabilota bacterium]|jgi:hypothetical protein|nr:hypothetical protein [Methylomirabilota bacterium]
MAFNGHWVIPLWVILALIAVATLTVPATKAADPPATKAPRSYPIPSHGVLELDGPTAWKSSLDQPPGGRAPTITFTPSTTQEFEFKVTVSWDQTRPADAFSPAAIRSFVQHMGQKLLPTAVEKTLVVEPLPGQTPRGYHYTLTDKSSVGKPSAPGDYPYVIQGMTSAGDLLLAFSYFFRTKEGPDREAALAMLAGARAKSEVATTLPPAPSGPLSLSLPGYRWGVRLDLAGFAITGDEMNSARTARRIAAEKREGSITLTAFLERVPEPMDAKACRTYYAARLQRSPIMKGITVRMSELGELAVLDYLIKDFQGVPINQKHVNAYLGQEGACLDVHLSKIQFVSGDEASWQNVLTSIRVEAR